MGAQVHGRCCPNSSLLRASAALGQKREAIPKVMTNPWSQSRGGAVLKPLLLLPVHCPFHKVSPPSRRCLLFCPVTSSLTGGVSQAVKLCCSAGETEAQGGQ